jgi:chromosome segregation ATPase
VKYLYTIFIDVFYCIIFISLVGVFDMYVMSIKNNIDNLKNLSSMRQNKFESELNKLEQEKKKIESNIKNVEREIDLLLQKPAECKRIFHASLKDKTVNSNEFKKLPIALAKINQEIEKNEKKLDRLITEYEKIKKDISVNKEKLKEQIVKNEKYNELKSYFCVESLDL